MMKANVFILIILGLDKSSFVKSLNDSKILRKRQNRNESIISKKSLASNIFENNPTVKLKFKNDREDFDKNIVTKVEELNLIKDISGITQRDNYYIKENITNSIFYLDNMSSENYNQDEEDLDKKLNNLQLDNKNLIETNSGKKSNAEDSARILGEFYFNVSKLFFIII